MRTQTREEQKAVLDAAWNGELCEWQAFGGKWLEGDLATIFARIYEGKMVRIKPKPDPFAELKAAHAAGKVIEWKCGSDWYPAQNPGWSYTVDCYRIRPEPELVPLEASNIPPVCWLRIPGVVGDILVTAVYKDCIFAGHGRKQPYNEMMNWEYSPDRINCKACSKP